MLSVNWHWSEPKYAKVSKSLPEETGNKYKSLLHQYANIFAWSYSDLKTYDKGVMEHKIPLKTDAKPVIQKMRHINPMLLPIIEKEIKKLWEARIIIPLRFSNWVANIVSVRKKEWRNPHLCRFS